MSLSQPWALHLYSGPGHTCLSRPQPEHRAESKGENQERVLKGRAGTAKPIVVSQSNCTGCRTFNNRAECRLGWGRRRRCLWFQDRDEASTVELTKPEALQSRLLPPSCPQEGGPDLCCPFHRKMGLGNVCLRGLGPLECVLGKSTFLMLNRGLDTWSPNFFYPNN